MSLYPEYLKNSQNTIIRKYTSKYLKQAKKLKRHFQRRKMDGK